MLRYCTGVGCSAAKSQHAPDPVPFCSFALHLTVWLWGSTWQQRAAWQRTWQLHCRCGGEDGRVLRAAKISQGPATAGLLPSEPAPMPSQPCCLLTMPPPYRAHMHKPGRRPQLFQGGGQALLPGQRAAAGKRGGERAWEEMQKSNMGADRSRSCSAAEAVACRPNPT